MTISVLRELNGNLQKPEVYENIRMVSQYPNGDCCIILYPQNLQNHESPIYLKNIPTILCVTSRD